MLTQCVPDSRTDRPHVFKLQSSYQDNFRAQFKKRLSTLKENALFFANKPSLKQYNRELASTGAANNKALISWRENPTIP